MSHGRCLCYVSGPGNIAVAFLFMEGQRALGFNQTYLYLCLEDERRSYRFEMTRGSVINVRIVIFGRTNALTNVSLCHVGLHPKA